MQNLVLFLVAGIVLVTACNDRHQSESNDNWIPKQLPLADDNPMKKFEGFVGEWDCIEKSWLAGNIEQSFKSKVQIYFLTDQLTLCVDHSGVDAPFRFIGYHKYEQIWGNISTGVRPIFFQRAAMRWKYMIPRRTNLLLKYICLCIIMLKP